MKTKGDKAVLPDMMELNARTFIVRNKAGFNKVVRIFKEHIKRSGLSTRIVAEDPPRKYPALVRMESVYRTFHYYEFTSHDLKAHCDKLRKELELIEQYL